MMPVLKKYIESSQGMKPVPLKRRWRYRPAINKESTLEWLQRRALRKAISENAYGTLSVKRSEGTSLWNIVQGLSAMARDRKHIDTGLISNGR